MTTISIIIPIYNVEPYIKQCIQSVANQTMTEGVECVLIDDCGTDKSIQIAEDFIDNYQGNISFRMIHHEQNGGLSAARNTGIRAARGEYIYFFDSDDTIIPECLADFTKIIKEYPNIDLIQGFIDQNTPYMNQFNEKSLPDYTNDRRFIKKALLDYDILPVCAANKMVRRQLIIDNDLFFKEGIIHEDNHWSFFLAKYVRSLAVYKKKCYIYTENPNSIMKSPNIAKECLSAHVIMEDFCNNIDDILSGEQKATILKHLNNVINNKFYKDENDKLSLYKCLYNKCTIIEKMILKQWYFMKNNLPFKTRLFNLCIRVFRLRNVSFLNTINK